MSKVFFGKCLIESQNDLDQLLNQIEIVKYPIVYPTTIDTELGRKMKAAILQDSEAWNGGYDILSKWADTFYTTNASYDLRGEVYDVNGLKEALKDSLDSVKRVRINNILISED